MEEKNKELTFWSIGMFIIVFSIFALTMILKMMLNFKGFALNVSGDQYFVFTEMISVAIILSLTWFLFAIKENPIGAIVMVFFILYLSMSQIGFLFIIFF